MNKGRLEAFSDGIFSIAMTLLILEVKIPELAVVHTNTELWQQLFFIVPVLATYFVSFAILGSFWINHHFIFHTFAKAIDRKLNLLNLLYLSFIAFVPFSSHLLGNFSSFQPAALIYGFNIFIVVSIAWAMLVYIRRHPELVNEKLSQRLLNQARFRTALTLICYIAGILCSFYYIPATLVLFAFPIVFNIIPGTLDLLEQTIGFSLD